MTGRGGRGHCREKRNRHSSSWGARWATPVLLLLALALITGAGRAGQSSTSARLFAMQRLTLECELAEARMARTEVLAKEGLASAVELREARAALERARIDLREAIARYEGDVRRVLLESVILTADEQGRPVVRLVFHATGRSVTGEEVLRRAYERAGLEPEKRPSSGGVVSIWARDEIVGLPLTRWVEWPVGDAQVTTSFLLQEDVTSVTVRLETGGERREWTAPLLADESLSALEVTCAQPAQEAPLGAQVAYQLDVRRRTGRAATYALSLAGEGSGLRHWFTEGQSRVSTIRFNSGELEKQIVLLVELPERPTELVRPEVPLRFSVLVVPEEGAREGESGSQASVDLRILPHGVGRLALRADRVILSPRRGATCSTRLEVRNTGSGALNDISLQVQPAVGWCLNAEPKRIASLAPDEASVVTLEFIPTEKGLGGDYDFTVEVHGFTAGHPVKPAEKRFTVTVTHGAGAGFVVLVLGGLVAVLAALGWLAARLARRGS